MKLTLRNLGHATKDAGRAEVEARQAQAKQVAYVAKLDVDAAAMRAQEHLANQELAAAKTSESNAKKDGASATVQENGAVAVERKTKSTNERVKKAAKATENRVVMAQEAQEQAQKHYDSVAGASAAEDAQSRLDSAQAELGAASTQLSSAQNAKIDADEKLLEIQLVVKRGNENGKKMEAKANNAVGELDANNRQIRRLKEKVALSDSDGDKLAYASKLTEFDKAKSQLVTKKTQLLRAVKAQDKKNVANMKKERRTSAIQGDAAESLVKAQGKEMTAKVAVKNSRSEKGSKQNEKDKLAQVNKVLKEAQTKAEAAKILGEKSREISIKKLKQRLSF